MKIKKGDKVKVLNGKDRGKEGTVQKVFRKTNKVIVEGANMVTVFKKHKSEQEKGGISKIESPMPISKVQIIDPKTGKATRIGYKVENGKKVRVNAKTKEVI